MKKVILVITIIILILTSYIVPSIASSTIPEVKEEIKLADNDATSIKGLLDAGKDFIKQGEDQQKDKDNNPLTIDEELLGNAVGYMYKIILIGGTALAVVVGVIIGIEFMMASSADERAKWKETIKVYVVGVIIVYGALGIWYLLLGILNKVAS